MEEAKVFSFIDSELSFDDANELLMELLRNKINFHKVKNFSSVIRFDKSDIDSKEKIDELTRTRDHIRDFITAAKNSNKKISIFSEFIITVKD